MNGKSLFGSKTFWFGVTQAVLGAVVALSGQDWVKSNPSIVAGFSVVAGVLTIVLRMLTTEPIRVGK